MRTLTELFQTPRMFYVPLSANNSVAGLFDLVTEVMNPSFIMVEIGSFAGVSSDLFARYCQKIYCVDIWDSDPSYQEIDPKALSKAKEIFYEVYQSHSTIEPIQNFSEVVAEQFQDGELDMVYIDGRHDYPSVLKDIQLWLPKIKPGGWITGHDIDLEGERVLKAVTELFGSDYKTYTDTSWAHHI